MNFLKPAVLAVPLLCFLGFALFGCERSIEWNQRTILHFETPYGPMQASGVIAVRFGHPTAFSRNYLIGGGGLRSQVRGEAVVADFGDGKVLIALLQNLTPALRTAVYHQQEDVAQSSHDRNAALRTSKAAAGHFEPIDVARQNWPKIVTFANLSDPTTIKLVDPNRISLVIGDGFTLTHVTVQATTDPVTRGNVAKVLPCFDSREGCVTPYQPTPYSHPLGLLLGGLGKSSF